MASIALVLGAGGLTGSAFSTGALTALSDVTGWDPRRAGVIVGTSAGAGFGATIRAGISVQDHYARARGEALSPEAQELVDRQPPLVLGTRPRLTGIPTPQSPLMIAEGVLGRWPPRPGLAIAGAFPRGTVSTESLGARIEAVHPDRWPAEPLWICSVRLKDGKRVVFGRDDIDIPHLGLAVRASSSIPGWFEPVRIGDYEYVDGGGHSPTNADLVAGLGFDLAVVVAPMAGAVAGGDDLRRDPVGTVRSLLSLATAGRALNRTMLGQELKSVASAVPAPLCWSPRPTCSP